MRNLIMNEDLPQATFFDDFYFWFDRFNKEEFYATPMYFYKADFNMVLEKKYREVYWKEKEGTDNGLKHPATLYVPFKEKLGTFLLRFLNADLTTYETAYRDFFYAYGFEILKDVDKDYKFKLKANYGNDENFLKETMKIYFTLKEKLIDIQKELINVVNYTYNLDNKEELKPYTYLERYTVYIIKHIGKFYTYAENDEVIEISSSDKFADFEKDDTVEMLEKLNRNPVVISMQKTHKSIDLSSICYAILEEITSIPNFPIKKCQNCGMYFIPFSRSDIIYCNYPKPDGKTCEEKGAFLSYKKKLQENKALAEYRKVYHTKFQQVGRNKDNAKMKVDFEEWKKLAKEKVKQMKKGELGEDEVYEWIVRNK